MSTDAKVLAKELKEVDDDKKLTDAEKTARKALIQERYDMEVNAETENTKRTGVGTRVFVGSTRGRNVMNIKYEAFDESKPDTLPTSLEQFCNLLGIKLDAKASQIMPMLIVGYNDQQYTEASDPIAEFVNPAWPDETKLQFRTVVRNIAKMQEIPIAEAVEMVKPGTEKKFLASQKVA